MPTQTQLKAMGVYANLMEEAKIRIDFLNRLVTGKSNAPKLVVRELCFLQLRMMCETVAVGCLVAHGDIAATQGRLQKEWAADKIISMMSGLHGDFFPQPFVESIGSDGMHQIQPAPPGHLTKNELVTLYHKCGDELHRGSLKKVLSATGQDTISLVDCGTWTSKFIGLLTRQIIFLLDQNAKMICTLWTGNESGRVQVAFAETVW